MEYPADFRAAFERTLGHEKGFQRDPADSGNWTGGRVGVGQLKGTKFGISAAAYPAEDIEGLTINRAMELYWRDYWGAAGCSLVPEVMRDDLFDVAVLAGVGAARRMLQRAAGVHDDGEIGRLTMLAISSFEPYRLAARFQGQFLDYLNNNPQKWARFGRGWAQRVAENLKAV